MVGTPVPLARDPFRSVGNGVIWQAPDGLVWLFYVVRYGETWWHVAHPGEDVERPRGDLVGRLSPSPSRPA